MSFNLYSSKGRWCFVFSIWLHLYNKTSKLKFLSTEILFLLDRQGIIFTVEIFSFYITLVIISQSIKEYKSKTRVYINIAITIKGTPKQWYTHEVFVVYPIYFSKIPYKIKTIHLV